MSMKLEQLVAIDLGNGSTSYKAGNGASGEYPSLVAPYAGSSLGGALSREVFTTKNGRRYLVGDDCREEGARSRSTDSSFYKSDEIRVLFLKVLKDANIKNPVIATGLPTEFFATHAAEFEADLKKWAREDGYHPELVKILPQFAGPWFDPELEDEEGNPLDPNEMVKGKYGIIDIGYGTIDGGQFNNGRVSDIRYGESSGVSDIHKAIYTSLSNPEQLNELITKKGAKLPKNFALDNQINEYTMDVWLREGHFIWRGTKIDMEPISFLARQAFTDQTIPRFIKQLWGSTDFLKGMVAAGGGTTVLGRPLLKRHITCPIYSAKDPDKSIVRGYYRFMVSQYFKEHALIRQG